MTQRDRCSRSSLARALVLLGVAVLPSGAVLASPINPSLGISALLDLSVNSLGPTANATRTGILTLTEGGLDTQTNVADAQHLTGLLTDTGDGLRLNLSVSGAGTDELAAVAIDTEIRLANTAADRFFDVVFRIDYDLGAGVSGADALGSSYLEVIDATTTNLMAPQLVAVDTVFGPLMGAGSGSSLIQFTLAPGQSRRLLAYSDVYGKTNADGQAEPNDQFSATGRVSITLQSAEDRPVPLPAPLYLIPLGLGALLARGRPPSP